MAAVESERNAVGLDNTEEECKRKLYKSNWNRILVQSDWKQVAEAVGGNSKLPHARNNMSQLVWETSRLQQAKNN